MLQSLRVLQLGLQVAVLALVAAAVCVHSWEVIEFKTVSNSSGSSAATSAQQLAFAPDGYCVHRGNGSSVCHPYLYAILENAQRPDDWPSTAPDPLAIHPGLGKRDSDNNDEFVLDQALTCWCQTRGELSFVVQGTRSMACLVVLETCKYTMALWGFFASLGLGLSTLFSARRIAMADGCYAFCSYASAMLGLLAAMAWWFYSSSYIDHEYLTELELLWRHGASFYLTLAALVVALANAAVVIHVSEPSGTKNLAQLHACPSAVAGNPDALDPLSCPANYLV
ncbi:hypothetical protein BBJ28_00021388 [Nothophytophthora sp. Chile5]|nr:hypothetical protein BBJ28_00021388 [Nothophytophthora sp. Chile5]